jgi:membrane protein
MIWLQVSWIIVLFGAEIAFAHQNVDTYEMETMSDTVSSSLKKILALRIANMCIKNFVRGEPPWSGQQISEALELPVRLTNKLLSDLVQCHVLTETLGKDEKITYYQPARDAGLLTINYVVRSLENLGNDNITYADSDELKKIKKYYAELDITTNKSEANILLKDI